MTVLIAAVAAFPALAIVRFQLFSLALFPLLMLLLRAETRRPTRRIWLAPPLLALWANLHGAVLVGLALLLVYLAVFRLRRAPLEALAVGAAACVACCLTPALWRTPLYFRGVLENEAARRGHGLWAPLSVHAPFDVVLAVGAIVLLVLALRAGTTRWELVAFAGLLLATVHASRSGVWLVLALAPRAAQGLPYSGSGSRRLVLAVAAVGAAATLLAVDRGPASTGASAALVARTLAAAHGRPVLAEDVLAEQVALAGGRIWIGNPIDAFSRSDQSTYLDWLDGRPGGDADARARRRRPRRAAEPCRTAHRRDPAFVSIASDGHAKLFVRRPKVRSART